MIIEYETYTKFELLPGFDYRKIEPFEGKARIHGCKRHLYFWWLWYGLSFDW